MKNNLLKTILSLVLASVLASSVAEAGQNIILSPRKVGPGDVMLVTVKHAKGPVEGTFAGKTIYFVPAKNAYKAIVGIDLMSETGAHDLDLVIDGKNIKKIVNVSRKRYPVQQLTLPKDMVELSPENEARVEREQKLTAALWPGRTDRVWSGNFMNPRPGKIVTPFGVKRFINAIPKSPHTGVDVSAEEGDEVKAPNGGIAVLADNLFFSGNSIVLDHGQGIYTMFFHLSKMLVKPGQRVAKGDVIGLVGSTGRSTGAHLHWGARVMGARIDPLELIALKLE